MKKNSKIYLTVGIIVIVLIAIILAVSAPNSGTNTINIGLLVASTGPAPVYGEWQVQGAEIAKEDLQNKNINVNLITEDSKGDPKEAVTAFDKLINVNNVKVIVSGSFSRSVMAMAPIANKNKVILFSTLSSSPGVTKAGDYIFRNRVSGALESQAVAKEMEKEGINKVATISFNDESGQSYVNSFKENFTGTIVSEEFSKPGQSDFKTEITKIKAKKPEAVFIVLDVAGTSIFLKESKELGLTTKFFAVSSVQSASFLKTAGNTAEGLIFATEGILINNKKYKSFEKEYNSKYHSEPTIYAINSYDAVNMMTSLIQKYGYNTDKIKNALHAQEFDGAEGTFSFDSNGDVKKKVVLKTVKNGKFVPYTA